MWHLFSLIISSAQRPLHMANVTYRRWILFLFSAPRALQLLNVASAIKCDTVCGSSTPIYPNEHCSSDRPLLLSTCCSCTPSHSIACGTILLSCSQTSIFPANVCLFCSGFPMGFPQRHVTKHGCQSGQGSLHHAPDDYA